MTTETVQYWQQRLTIPAYRVGEAASYAGVKPQTVSAWHRLKQDGQRRTLSAKEQGAGLSFLQLIELAVVADMRAAGVKLKEVERARSYFKETTGLEFPFAQLRFKTDGADILADFETADGKIAKGKLVAANHQGQLIWSDIIAKRFKEFQYGEHGEVLKWKVAGVDKPIEIDPRLSFGAPQVSGIRTAILKSRWLGGEEVDELADDFSISEGDILEALLFEGIFSENERLSKWIH